MILISQGRNITPYSTFFSSGNIEEQLYLAQMETGLVATSNSNTTVRERKVEAAYIYTIAGWKEVVKVSAGNFMT